MDKVHQRIGRAKEKYPSAQQYYIIEVTADKKAKRATEITWEKDQQKHDDKIESLGIYFLRTNMNVTDEVVVWNIYNTIREIENEFRTLETDLALRSIYHKSDKAKCSQPNEKLKTINDILKANYKPFKKRKSVEHKVELKKIETQQQRLLPVWIAAMWVKNRNYCK